MTPMMDNSNRSGIPCDPISEVRSFHGSAHDSYAVENALYENTVETAHTRHSWMAASPPIRI